MSFSVDLSGIADEPKSAELLPAEPGVPAGSAEKDAVRAAILEGLKRGTFKDAIAAQAFWSLADIQVMLADPNLGARERTRLNLELVKMHPQMAAQQSGQKVEIKIDMGTLQTAQSAGREMEARRLAAAGGIQ